MKPLSHKQKAFAYRWFLHSPLRKVVEPLYMTLLKLELRGQRVMDSMTKPNFAPDLRDVTAVIKTFERPQRCRELVDSIRRFYPELAIIVVDDSRQVVPIPNVTAHIMPYDSGVSAGRSEGLKLVNSKYVLNLDDDFVFFQHTDVLAAVKIMNRYDEIDLMGGMVIDLPLYITHESRGSDLFNHSTESIVPPGQLVGGLKVHDKVANFFIARADSLRNVDWDRGLKRLDHADFFTRAKGRLLSVYNPAFKVLHVKNPFDIAYLNVRLSLDEDLAYLARKYARPWRSESDEYSG